MHDLLAFAVSAVLGGGLFKGLGALAAAFSNAKEKRKLGEALGAKTPAEIESISIATMTTALHSASSRIADLEKEREADKLYYQGRISELTDQLQRVRAELSEMEKKLTDLLADTNHSEFHREVR